MPVSFKAQARAVFKPLLRSLRTVSEAPRPHEEPNTGGIKDEQPNPMERTGGVLDETFDFFPREDFGQTDRPFGDRHIVNQPWTFEGLEKQEPAKRTLAARR